MPHTSAALAQVPDETIPVEAEVAGGYTPKQMDAWRETLGGVVPTIGARIESKLAGVQELTGKGQYADARKKYWQSMILPRAAMESKDAGIALTDHPDVVDNAKRLRMSPGAFAGEARIYQDMSEAELTKFQADQRERIAAGLEAATKGGARRQLAAQVSAGVRPDMPEWSPRSIAFDAMTGVPDLLIGLGGAVAGGPVVGLAAMMASIAPEEWSAAKNQGLDDKTAATYATLSTLSQAAPEVPVLRIVSGGAAGRSILRKVVGEALADSPVGKVAGTAVTQGVAQSVIQGLQEGIDAGLIDRETSLKEALSRISRAGVIGTAIGAPIGVLHAGRAPREAPAPSPEVQVPRRPELPPLPERPKSATPAQDALEAFQKEGEGRGIVAGSQAGIHFQNLIAAAQREKARLGAPEDHPVGDRWPPPEPPPPGGGEPPEPPDGGGGTPEAPTGRAAPGAPGEATDTRAALQALQDKTISPPQMEHLESLGLARRNDLGVPFMLPAGRRALAAPAAAEVTPASPTGSAEKPPPERAQQAPEPSVRPTEALPKPQVPLEDRLKTDTALRDTLTAMKAETGWQQKGGALVRNAEGEVTGRTSWLPNAEWWRDRPKGLTEDQVHVAIEKALNGEPLGKRERSMVEFMAEHADQRAAAPAKDFTQRLEQARSDTETAPTEGQKTAGNFAKGELQFAPGLTFTMENPKGSTRSGTDAQGKPWRSTLATDYGYINRSEGADGDHVDAFLTGKPDTGHAYIVNQVDPVTGKWDEHKLLLGASSLAEAKATYLANYPKGWKGMGSIVEMPTERLKNWLEHGDTTKPAEVSTERREDVGRRKAVAAMTPQEMRETILTHELTGLPNRRAYEEAPRLSHQVSVDVDSLKWINDNLGHAHGDEVLKGVAEALKAQTGHAFHISGDEFVVQAHDEAEGHEIMQEVADALQGAEIKATSPDGKVVEINGLGVSYGVGKSLHEADKALSTHKANREARGERAARGEKPPTATYRTRSREGLEAESHVAEAQGIEHARVREDQATYTAAHPVSGGGGELGVADRRDVPAGATLQLFSSDEAPAASLARTQTHTGLIETGRFSSGIKQVKRWQDAAHIFAPLRKSPQESMMALVVDAKARPLAVIRHSIGSQSGANVVPSLVTGAVAKIEHAAGVYFGHNHPSAVTEQSTADIAITNRLHDLMRGSGIDPLGMVVVTPGGLEASFYHPARGGEQSVPGKTTAAARAKRGAIPVLERRFTSIPPTAERGMPIRGHEAAIRAVEASGEKSGILLLDNRNGLAAVLPMHPKEMATLRTGDKTSGMLHVMRAVEDANASNAITFGQEADVKALMNLGKLLSDSDVRLRDTLINRDGKWEAHGQGMEAEGPFYARREGEGPGTPRVQVERAVRIAVRDSGMRAAPDFPHVEVHQDYTTLPRDLREKVIQDHSEETAGAVYDPETGQIHMIADNLGTPREAVETLWHEAVGHHGLRLIMDADRYGKTMDGIWNAMPDRVLQTAERNGLDVSELAQRRMAAEEVIAYAAGQHLAGTAIDKPLRPFWQRALAAVRGFFARVTGTPFTDDKAIAGIIAESKRALESGSGLQRMGALAASQRAATFYSPVERAVTASKQGKASAEQWMATLRKTPGIKPEELEYLGLEDWLKQQKGPVTRETLADYVRANKLELEETLYGPGRDRNDFTEEELLQTHHAEALRAMGAQVEINPDGSLEHVTFRGSGTLPPEMRPHVEALRDASEQVAAVRKAEYYDFQPERGPQYGEFTLPGGENYHEALIRLPVPGDYLGRRDNPLGSDVFQSPHWQERNVLAHVRFDDRTDSDGKKTLFLQELQSDWHQRGREKGYRDKSRDAEYERADADLKVLRGPALEAMRRNDNLGFDSEHAALAAIREHADWKERWTDVPKADQEILDRYRDAFRRRVEARVSDAVPSAPFRGTWPMLLMKRMIRHAAESGHERIAWTTGKTQIERYSLAKHVDKVEWSAKTDGGRVVRMVGPQGTGSPAHIFHFTTDPSGEVVTPFTASASRLMGHSLDEIVGKEMARKIMGEESGELTGANLDVGGSGMRAFYDDILPRETNKLIRKYGAEVGTTTIKADNAPEEVVNRVAAEEPGHPFVEKNRTPVHTFDITPQLREQALSQGFPMFWKKPSQQTAGVKKGQGPGWYEAVRRAVTYLHSNPVTRDMRKVINPTKLSEEAKSTAVIARAALGNLAHQTFETQEALEKFSRQIDRLPPREQLEMMDAIEHGVPQPNADLQPVADALRHQLDTWREKVRGLGVGALDNFIENYFPHYWSKPDQAQRMIATIMGRRPLRGPASFLKMRTIPTIKEGMDAGLTPLTINPLVMTLLKVREMQRFVSGVKMMQSFKDAGLAQFLRSGKPMPEGWAEIKDNIARVRQWSEEEQGFIERGKYIMPEDGARLINNHVGRSAIADFAPLQVIRVGANLLNATQLGWSAYHLGFTTFDAWISKNSLGIERLAHGEPLRALAAFAEAPPPLGVAMNIHRGRQLLRFYANPSGATPQMERIVRALELGGGRVRMDRYYLAIHGVNPFRGVGVRSLAGDIRAAIKGPEPVRGVAQAVGNFPMEYATKAFRELQAMTKTMPALQVPFEIAGRIVRMSTSWIMEGVVPLQKLGVFSDMAQDYLRRNPTATDDQLAKAAQKMWDAVDDRLGEMVYDNLFWDRTAKDAAHLGMRAVGWNTGTVRLSAGAGIDTLALIDKLAREGKITADDLGHRIPYMLAMGMTTAMVGATINYLFTGKGPQELKDYYFPRSGGVTSFGTPQRLSMPTYVKDIYEFSQRPGRTMLNKANPIWSTLADIWENEDFFGHPISEPEAGWFAQAGQRAAFSLRQAEPFSFQSRQQLAGSEKPGVAGEVKKAMPFIGFGAAPAYVTSPDQLERRARFEAEDKYSRELRYKLNKAMAAHDKDEIKSLTDQYVKARRRAMELKVEVQKDKAKSARARHQNATSMRQQGFPATASLIASLPLEPDTQAREYFRSQA